MNLWDCSNAAPHPLRTSKLQSVIATGVCFLASVTSGQMDSSASSHGLGSRLHVCLHSGARLVGGSSSGHPLFMVVPGPTRQHTQSLCSGDVGQSDDWVKPSTKPVEEWALSRERSGRLSE